MTEDEFLDHMKRCGTTIYRCECGFRGFGGPIAYHTVILKHHSVREFDNPPIEILERARTHVKNDWAAFAILTEAILAFKYKSSKFFIRDFAYTVTRRVHG